MALCAVGRKHRQVEDVRPVTIDSKQKVIIFLNSLDLALLLWLSTLLI